MITATLRQACLALVAPAVASRAIPAASATRWADLWASYVATGRAAGDAAAIPFPLSILTRKGAAVMAVQIPWGFQARLHIPQPVDGDGQPTAFGAPVAWAAGDGAPFSATPEGADGMVGLIDPTAEGEGTLTLTTKAGGEADAADLRLEVQVQVIAGDAVALNVGDVELIRKDPPAGG